MTTRKTAGQRVSSFQKSERADAKFLLLAMAPISAVVISDQIGLLQGALRHWLFWLSAVWGASIIAAGFTGYWRALRQASRRDDT